VIKLHCYCLTKFNINNDDDITLYIDHWWYNLFYFIYKLLKI